MNIGDIFFMFRGASEALMVDAEKSGAAAGTKGGKSFSDTFKKAAAGAIGAGIGVTVGAMLAGATQLDAATRKLQADTGMTADEAKRAEGALADMYRNNLQGFAEIGDAMAAVHNDLGLTGDEADAVTRKILKFSTATGINAAEAVTRLDDILDNWGLTAADADGLLDRLIVSHQKWGGSILDNETTLAKLAPAMRAANFSIDDAIALLGLFGAKGLDSERAAAAFSKALNKVKSPEELQKLITDISNTEDPFARAQKAAGLFGVKAGAQLANALGGVDFRSYAIGAEEAAGATERASDAIESGFGAQFKLILKNAGGALAEFGTQFGGLLMVASAFGPAMLAKIGAGLGAIGGVLGARLVVPIGKALTTALGLAILDASSSSVVVGAIDKLGAFMGTKLGKSLSVAFAAVAVFEVYQTYTRIKGELQAQGDEIGKSVANQVATGTLEQLQVSKAAVQKGIADLNGVFDLGLFSNDTRAMLDQKLVAIDKGITNRLREAAGHGAQASDDLRVAVVNDMTGPDGVSESFSTVGAEAYAAARKTDTAWKDITTATQLLVQAVRREIDGLIDDTFEPLNAEQALIAANAEASAARVILASKKSSEAQKAEARATLISTGESIAKNLAILATAGKANSKAYTEGIKNLEQLAKDLGGDATEAGRDMLALIAKIKAAREEAAKGITLDVIIRTLQQKVGKGHTEGNAAGGPVQLGEPSWIGEYGRELWVPTTPGVVIPHDVSEALVAGDLGRGGNTYNIMLPGPPTPDPFETARQLRRLSDFGVLA